MQIRKIIDHENVCRFPVVMFLEFVMPLFFPGFYYVIATKQEMGKKHGDTDVVNRCIRIREDIYYGALEGKGRDRMTIAHEIAHYIIHVVCGVQLSRTFDNISIPPFRDPEWQAKALAGELMCPAHLIANMTPAVIAAECGVSLDAAEFQLKKL